MSSYLDSDEVYIRNDDDLSESLRAMQNERLEIFTQQNLEEGLFDIAFEVEGKTLHAHKFIIASISETMKCWLSDRWTAKDEVIKIENYSYDEFYEFLTFLYSSQCKLTKENIVKMTDMAEFYGVQCLKDFCDEFLTAMKKSVETIEELFVFAQTYSLPKLESSLESFFWSNYEKLCKSDAFISFKKPFVEFLCAVDFIYRCKKEILFESVYKWAEHRILKDKSVDGDESFNLREAVKAELSTFLSHFYFPKMNFNFLMDFVVEKGYHLSPAELSQFYSSCNNYFGFCEEFFKNTYELAEKQALKKQETLREENFDLATAINAYLIEVIPKVPFSTMSFDFLTNFVLEKRFLLSPANVSQYFLSRKVGKSLDSESSFKETVELAEKVALKKQEMFPEDDFNLVNSVKAYLVDVLPNVDFSKMDNSFLTDFIVSNGIISEEQINQLFETEVEIKNSVRIITGTFKDVHRIRLFIEKKKKSEKYVKRQSTSVIRFPDLKFPDPSIPSTVEKMKGCDWYFCLDDEVLSFKHRTSIQQDDYLIAEMKSRTEFKLVPGETTFLTVRLKKV